MQNKGGSKLSDPSAAIAPTQTNVGTQMMASGDPMGEVPASTAWAQYRAGEMGRPATAPLTGTQAVPGAGIAEGAFGGGADASGGASMGLTPAQKMALFNSLSRGGGGSNVPGAPSPPNIGPFTAPALAQRQGRPLVSPVGINARIFDLARAIGLQGSGAQGRGGA